MMTGVDDPRVLQVRIGLILPTLKLPTLILPTLISPTIDQFVSFCLPSKIS